MSDVRPPRTAQPIAPLPSHLTEEELLDRWMWHATALSRAKTLLAATRQQLALLSAGHKPTPDTAAAIAAALRFLGEVQEFSHMREDD